MYNSRKMIWYGVLFIIGISLVLLSVFGITGNEYVSGFGGGMCGVALVRLVLGYKYRNNEEYAKKIDIANSDERNLYISGKAKSWAFYITIIGLAVCGVIMLIIGQELLAQCMFMILAAMTLIYYIAYIILNKNY